VPGAREASRAPQCFPARLRSPIEPPQKFFDVFGSRAQDVSQSHPLRRPRRRHQRRIASDDAQRRAVEGGGGVQHQEVGTGIEQPFAVASRGCHHNGREFAGAGGVAEDRQWRKRLAGEALVGDVEGGCRIDVEGCLEVGEARPIGAADLDRHRSRESQQMRKRAAEVDAMRLQEHDATSIGPAGQCCQDGRAGKAVRQGCRGCGEPCCHQGAGFIEQGVAGEAMCQTRRQIDHLAHGVLPLVILRPALSAERKQLKPRWPSHKAGARLSQP
jgi:hypothetical protein